MTRGVIFWFLPILFLSCFSVYLVTLGPAFQPDDSAETIAACVTLTPQHPSGYPIATFIGRLFALVPIGNPALRLNLMAAGLGSVLVSLAGLYLFQRFRFPLAGEGGARVRSWSFGGLRRSYGSGSFQNLLAAEPNCQRAPSTFFRDLFC